MCASKLKLPTSATPKNNSTSVEMSREDHLTRRAQLASDSKITTAKMEVLGQALDVIKQALRVAQSYVELQTACVEWQGRVQVADSAYRTALAELSKAKGDQEVEMRRLAAQEKLQEPIVSLFNKLLVEMDSQFIKEADRRRLINDMLQLAPVLAKLG